MSVNCYVRTIVPKDPSSSYLGQFDLKISGTAIHKGVEVKNPVYSYRTDGKLYVFSANYMSQNCTYINDNVEVYEWKFTASDSEFRYFYGQIDSVIGSFAYDSNKKCTVCTLNNLFSTYRLGTTDCFTAVAAWCVWLGNRTLQNIYDDRNNAYRAYLPLSLKEKYVRLGEWKLMTNYRTLAP